MNRFRCFLYRVDYHFFSVLMADHKHRDSSKCFCFKPKSLLIFSWRRICNYHTDLGVSPLPSLTPRKNLFSSKAISISITSKSIKFTIIFYNCLTPRNEIYLQNSTHLSIKHGIKPSRSISAVLVHYNVLGTKHRIKKDQSFSRCIYNCCLYS